MKHIVISVHGIRTYGHWQERLQSLLHTADHAIEYHAYTYGYFSIAAFLIPPLRWLVVRRFREALLRITHKDADARVDLVGHSFGTHVIAWGLLNTPPYLRPKVHTVILAGSVLRPGFPWQVLLGAGDVYRVINDCGIDDKVLWLNQLSVLFTGMAGRIGLAGLTSDRLLNRFFDGGHSLYFVDHDDKQSSQFMERYWIPLLLSSAPPQRVDQRGVPSAWTGLVQTIVQNSEPIKLAIYMALLLIPVLIYRHLYLNAKAEHAALVAEVNQNRRLYLTAKAARAEAVSQRDASIQTLRWAMNEVLALPIDETGGTLSANPAMGSLFGGIVYRLIDQSGFDGRIRIEGHITRFCLDSTGKHLAAPTSTHCNLSASREYSIGFGERFAQSVRRALLLSGLSEWQISTVSYGSERPKYCYPKNFTTAGQYNAIARLNARVEVVFLSKNATPPQPESTSSSSVAADEEKPQSTSCIPYSDADSEH